MGFSCGIVGLPNVGKSTLFNALVATAAAEAANYPFSTIEPNIGRVAVPDERLDICARLAGSKRIVPTQLEFVDIAGLVRGAARGEGLGNQFLAHIREVDAIAHVLRCFADPDVVHVEGSVDPLRDAQTVETELMLADLESLERRVAILTKRARGGPTPRVERAGTPIGAEARAQLAAAEPVLSALREGRPARRVGLSAEERNILKPFNLLSLKPVLYIANVDEASAAGNEESRRVARWAAEQDAPSVVISAAIEAELARLADMDEKQEFLAALGLAETGLARVIRAGYALLGLVTFFTAGPKETHAWTVERGTRAKEAAGRIHSDFERGFIRAETISYRDFVAHGGEQGAREAGRMRLEGADYLVADGDVMHFRFNV
jgi:GTP-binding protein YchF